jgi:pimeloyl-ACP methyl ester carboxylesterase
MKTANQVTRRKGRERLELARRGSIPGMATIKLSDGRSLHIEVSGPEDGPVVFFHHGTPGSGRPMRGMTRKADAHGVRLVTCSRAGYGGSSRNPGRRVVDVVGDVEQVIDYLGVERFLVAGKSGGGPHALATGAVLGDRVAGVCCIAGVAPYDAAGLDFLAGMGSENVVEFDKALAGEAALRPYLDDEVAALAGADVTGMIDAMQTVLPLVDIEVLSDEYGEDQLANMQEGLRTGADGWLADDLAFTVDWGFDLASIAVPTFIWQGSADLMVPYAHGQWLAANVPGAVAHLEPGAGHLSISVGGFDAMLDELLTTL